MTIRITGDGPKITATGSGSTVLVEISTGQHDPGSFSGVHNDLTGRSTTGAHVGTAVSIDPSGFAGNLDESITNAQLLAAAVDDLTTGGGGGGGGGASLSDATPQALGTAAAGTGTAAARDDHVHAMPTAADVGADADGAAQAVADSLGGAAVLDVGTTTGTVAAGDDARLSDARTPVSHNHAASEITSGTIDQARLGSGSAGAGAKFLADDQTYKTVSSGIADPGGSNDDFLQRKSSAWAARTIAQVKTDLGIADRNYYIDNEWYLLSHSNDRLGGASGYTPGTNAMAFWLIVVERTIQIDGCWFYLQATGTSAKMRPGIWAASATTGKPTGNPLVSAAEVDVSASTGYKSQTFTPVTVTPGIYWGGMACLGTATYRTWAAVSGAPPVDMGGPDSATTVNWSFNSPWTYSSSALPDVSGFTFTATTGSAPPSTCAPFVRWRVQIP